MDTALPDSKRLLGRLSENLSEVKEGIAPGDRVVVRGAGNLQEGVAVTIEGETPRPASPAPGDGRA